MAAPMRLIEQFVQVGFPLDGVISSLRVPPRWTADDLKIRALPVSNGTPVDPIAPDNPVNPGTSDRRNRRTTSNVPAELHSNGADPANKPSLSDNHDGLSIHTPSEMRTRGSTMDPTPSIIGQDGASMVLSPASEAGVTRVVGTIQRGNVTKKPPHPIEFTYIPSVIDSYPRVHDSPSKPEYLQHVPLFCFPDQMSIIECKGTPPSSSTHSFVLTREDGSKLYCSCIIFWEKPMGRLKTVLKYQCRSWYIKNVNSSDLEYLSHLRKQIQMQRSILAQREEMDEEAISFAEEKLKLFTDLMKPFTNTANVDVDNLWVPRAMCLFSSWPVYDFMEDYLKCIYTGMMDNNGSGVSLEACLVNLIHELPFPPPGRKEITICAHSRDLYFHRPAPNEIPLIKNFSFYPLFRALSTEDIVFLFECLLNERRILFVSQYPSMLNLAIQSLVLVMFPFTWFHVMISVVPINLLSYLEAPVPYLMGVLTNHLDLCENLEDVVIVKLDEGQVISRLEKAPVPLPNMRRYKLLQRLRNSCHIMSAGPPLQVVEAFPFGKLSCRTGHSKIGVRDVTESVDSSGENTPHNQPAHLDSPASSLSSAAHRTLGGTSNSGPVPALFKRGSSAAISPFTPAKNASPMTSTPSLFSFSSQSSRFTFRTLMASPSASRKIVEGHLLAEARRPAKCSVCDVQDGAMLRCDKCGLQVHGDCTGQLLEWCAHAFDETRIRRAFVKCFAALFKGYRSHLDKRKGFNTKAFVEADPDSRTFLQMFTETQAFMQFVQDRAPTEDGAQAADQEILFFDEMIKVKRGKFNISRPDSSFFKDTSFSISSTHRCTPPLADEQVRVYRSFPMTDPAVVTRIKPRKVQSLSSPQEEVMLTLYRAKVLRQAKRNAKNNGDWIKKAASHFGGYRSQSGPNSAEVSSENMSGGGRRGTVSGPSDIDMVLAESEGGSIEAVRALVEQKISHAWDILKDPSLGKTVKSRAEYAERMRILKEVKESLNEVVLSCDQHDLDDIVLITSQLDKLMAFMDDEFHSVFVDESTLSRIQSPPPVLKLDIPQTHLEMPDFLTSALSTPRRAADFYTPKESASRTPRPSDFYTPTESETPRRPAM